MSNSMDILGIIRKLAKTSKFQNLYSHAKELDIKIFRNNYDYTDLQLFFLSFLNFYSIINLDIALGEIDEIVLENDIYEDSYMMYRKKSSSYKNTSHNSKNIASNPKSKKEPQTTTSTWVFKTLPKEVK